jgi:chromosome segregation ATPase
MPDPILIQFKTDLTAIDNTIDSLEQLGMVDKATADSFRKTSAEAKKYQEEMTKTGKQVDAVTIDLEEMVKAMKEVPKKIIEDSAKKSLEDGAKATNDVADKSAKLTTQLRQLKQELSQMEMAGKANTAEYKRMAAQAGALEDQIGDTAARVRVLASDTKNLDAALSLATGIAGTFSIAQGATALFGDENEDLQKSLLKVQSALSILNGLQAIQATLNKNSAASVVILSNVQKAYTAYIGQSTGAMLLLKQASIGLGLPALGIAIYAAITAFKAWREEQDQVNAATARMIKINDPPHPYSL